MNLTVSTEVLARFSDALCAKTGLNFTPDRWPDLERGLVAATDDFGFKNPVECAQWLISTPLTPQQMGILATRLTVGETYFFREPRTFDILRQEILPALILSRRSQQRRLRIWSAGCCTGEEPYSIAILLKQILPDINDWDVKVLATDINPRFLHHAKEGLFTEWSFRSLHGSIKRDYFTSAGRGKYQIRHDLQNIVSFGYLNLAEEIYPSPHNNTHEMDIILCRNVLMYMSGRQTNEILHRFRRSLIENGWFIASGTETSQALGAVMTPVSMGEMTFYQKCNRDAAAPRPSSLMWPASLTENPIEPQKVFSTSEDSVAVPVESVSLPSVPCDPAPSVVAEATGFYDRGEYTRASEILQPWIDSHDTDAEAMALLARALANMGKLESALEWCGRAMSRNKLNPEWHFLRGSILEERQEWTQAEAAYRRTLYLEPAFAMAHVALGHLAQRQHDSGAACRHWNNAISLIQELPAEQIVPESGGLTAGRLAEIISSTAVSRGRAGVVQRSTIPSQR